MMGGGGYGKSGGKGFGGGKASTVTANLRTTILDFRGFDSSRILILRGGLLMSIGNFLESLSQAILVGIILVGRLTMTSTIAIYIATCSTPTSCGDLAIFHQLYFQTSKHIDFVKVLPEEWNSMFCFEFSFKFSFVVWNYSSVGILVFKGLQFDILATIRWNLMIFWRNSGRARLKTGNPHTKKHNSAFPHNVSP